MKMQLVAVDSLKPSSDIMKVSITKQGQMFILDPVANIHLKNKYIRLFVSPGNKDILAWSLHDEVPLAEFRDYKQIKQSKAKQLSVCIQKGISALKKEKRSYTRLSVQKYEDTSLLDGKTYYYVKLK